MPQTREHFDICRLLRRAARRHRADQDRRSPTPTCVELAALEVRELVAGSFLDEAPIVPVSARTGEGLDALRGVAGRAGRARRRPRDAGGAARLPVDRVFSMRGFGTVVDRHPGVGHAARRGRAAGPARRAHRQGARPAGARRRRAPTAVAGERVAVNLAGLEVADVPRGSVLATPAALPADAAGRRRADRAARRRRRSSTARGCACITARPRSSRGSSVAGDVGVVCPASARHRPACGSSARPCSPAAIASSCAPTRRWSTIGGGVVLDPDPPRIGVAHARGRRRASRRFSAGDDPMTTRARRCGRCWPMPGSPARPSIALLAQRLGLTAGARCGPARGRARRATARWSPRRRLGRVAARRWRRRWRRCWPGSRRSTAAAAAGRGRAARRSPHALVAADAAGRSSTGWSPS